MKEVQYNNSLAMEKMFSFPKGLCHIKSSVLVSVAGSSSSGLELIEIECSHEWR